MVTASGKLSRSFFRLISYDLDHGTSIILCSPLTGRSHQLRVHLQWLGYSIVNDTLYGGPLDPTVDLKTGLAQALHFLQCQRHSLSYRQTNISDEDAEAAAQVCSFCTAGPENAFSPAQLLQGGHEICLHAIRYRIALHINQANAKGCIHNIDARVRPPSWMSNVEDLIDKLPFEASHYEGEGTRNYEACSNEETRN
jgi:hypothetical protein